MSIINHTKFNLSDNDTSSEENIKKNNNDLGESETSIHLPIKNEKFHEIFSNSIVEEDINKNTKHPINQNKHKFFKKYLVNFDNN